MCVNGPSRPIDATATSYLFEKKGGKEETKKMRKKKVVAVYRKGQCVAGTITKRDG